MDKQAVFDQVLFNMRAQGKPAFKDGLSRYKVPGTDLRCPIGWVLGDLYDDSMENQSVSAPAVSEALGGQTPPAPGVMHKYLDRFLFKSSWESVERAWLEKDLVFYDLLQKAHDVPIDDLVRVYEETFKTEAEGPHFEKWIQPRWMAAYESAMASVARIYSLSYTDPQLDVPDDIYLTTATVRPLASKDRQVVKTGV